MSAQAAMARRKAYAVKRNHGYSYTDRRSRMESPTGTLLNTFAGKISKTAKKSGSK